MFNLTSGATINDSNAEILNIRKVGKDNYNEFKKNHFSSKLEKFQDIIERNDLPLLISANKSVQIKQNTRTKAVEIDRNIVGTLLAYCAKNEKVIDFEKALEYPLCSVPGGELPYEEYTGVCHELGSYFQEKIPKRVCQFFTKIPERL